MNKKLAIILGSIIGVIVLAVIIIFGANQVQQMQEHNAEVAAKEKTAALDKKKEKTFNKTLPYFVKFAQEVGVNAEDIGGKYHDVWLDTIDKGKVEIAGKTYTDFNDSLAAQGEVFDKKGDITTLTALYDQTKKYFSTLTKNQTKKNANKYDTTEKLFNTLDKFYSLTTSPTGSFSSFSEEYNKLDSDLASQLRVLQK
jgi:hypothetical protein